MRYTKGYLGCEQDFLEVTVFDNEDIEELNQYKDEKNVIISMSDLQYLSGFPHIERLIITSGKAPGNVSGILETKCDLRELKLDYEETEPFTDWCIDISKLYSLELLFSRSSSNFKGVSNSRSLKTLVVNNWYSDDLSQLKGSAIDTLSIGCGKLRFLTGIEKVPLVILSLSNLRYLTDISCVENIPLRILELDTCNQIKEIESILPPTLEYLMVYGKNRFRSGTFIKNYPKLKRVMLDVLIEDGDLSAFEKLESAVLLVDRRGYNRKNSQLPKSKYQYLIPSVPAWRYIYSRRNI